MTNSNLLAYCEYTLNPLGVNSKTPRFSWKIQNCPQMQTAYRVRVASSPQALEKDDLLWDSSVISGPETICRYAGPELESACLYYFDVQVWCGSLCFMSGENHFLTALYNREDWQGDFIRIIKSGKILCWQKNSAYAKILNTHMPTSAAPDTASFI